MSENTTIHSPVEFLTLYKKMEQLNPLAYERLCGIIDGLCIMESIKEKELAVSTKAEQ